MNYSPSGFNGYAALGSVNTPIRTTPIMQPGGGNASQLESLIANAIRRRSAPIKMGANNVPIQQNEVSSGYLDRFGNFHYGVDGGV